MKRRYLLVGALGLLIAGAIVLALSVLHQDQKPKSSSVDSYTSCVQAGYPVQESYPSVCRVPEGKSYVNPDEKVVPPSGAKTGSWCPINTTPGIGAPCFRGLSTDKHPSVYKFTADPGQ